MFGKASAQLFRKATSNREAPTEAEAYLWTFLNKNQLGPRFKRQHPLDRFIVDFYCHPLKLIIEVDGGYHQEKEQAEYDLGRTYHLEELDCTLIRFSNEAVLNDTVKVLSEIQAQIVRLAPLGK